jgi:hypothetical protein
MQRFRRIDGGRSSHTEACPSVSVDLKTAAWITRQHMGAALLAIVSFLGKSMIP